ncbi:MAG: WbqC family protein [Lacibacter sp.]
MIIIDLQYFGTVECISTLINATHLNFYTAKAWKKGCGLNRMWVAGSNNVISLTVPLVGGRAVKQPAGAVRISYATDWQRIHWRTLHDCYRKAPWFNEYAPTLEQLYQQRVERLVDWNRLCTEWALKALGLNSVILTEIAANADTAEFGTCNRQPVCSPPHHYPVYYQVFADRLGFVGNLSIVDLIFCEGPQALAYLQKIAAYVNTRSNAILPKENP